MTQNPPNAPYTITLDEPIEVRVELRLKDQDDPEAGSLIVGEVEYGGDTIGSAVDPLDLGDVTLELAVDEMVTGLSRYVWHELGGVPVFREEDMNLTGRVDVQSPWVKERRMPTRGLIANPEVLGVQNDDGLEEPIPTEMQLGSLRGRDEPPVFEGVVVAQAEVGDAMVTMSPEEMAQIARGQMPESFLLRVVAAMGDDELVSAIRRYIELEAENDPVEMPERDQAARALDEIERRLG